MAGLSLTITASFGVAVHGSDGGLLEDTLRAADLALYSAKDHGRNDVAVASTQCRSAS